jgi:homopolymeric O-antigen transport system ATP-binding protein
VNQPIISVENLSKAYRIGQKEDIPDTFVAAMTGWLKAPLRNWRRLRRLNTFGEAVSDELSAVSSQNGHNNGDHSPLTTHHSPNPQSAIRNPQSDTLWALRDVSFDVHEGEVVGIIGRNGAGKSTLLKILSRITEPTHGRAVIRGRVSSLLEVGTGFHPELTGRENIYMNGTILGMRKREIDRKFDEIVDFSGVERFLDTPIKRYSSGMQVRLAFAVAAHLEPEILIIDEVLAVGDAEFQKKCLGKMQDVASEGRTVLFVSHNMSAVTRLCTTGVVLSQGGTSFKGDSIDAVTHYLARHCHSSKEWIELGSSPGNESVRLRSARIVGKGGRTVESCTVDDRVNVEICYDVLQESVLVPNFHFYTGDGTFAFVSHDHNGEWYGRAKRPGRYVSRVAIPDNLLNCGWVTVGIAISSYRPFIVHCHERDALAFQVTENMDEIQKRGGFSGNMPGAVRPLLEWQTELIGTTE